MAIIYQLPNGKCVYLSIQQFLDLDDETIQLMVAGDMGHYSNNPFKKLNYPDLDSSPDELEEENFLNPENSPDMLSDGDDVDYDIDLDNIPDS